MFIPTTFEPGIYRQVSDSSIVIFCIKLNIPRSQKKKQFMIFWGGGGMNIVHRKLRKGL